MSEHPSKRLVADRIRRVWAVAEEIAANPGQSRLDLARHFFVSERQLQDDLDSIRNEMRLPLVRRQGYRFATENGATQAGPLALTLRDALTLISCLREAAQVRRDVACEIVNKLPYVVPPHMQPLMRLVADEATAPGRWRRSVTLGLIGALVQGGVVELHYPPGTWAQFHNAVMRPELLVPYLDGWYAIGAVTGDRIRSRMVRIDGLAAVTPAAWDGDGR